MKRLHSFVAVGIAFFLPAALLAWGPEGHEVVAALAESLLSDTAKSGVRSVISDSTLASVSNWADQVRSQRDETYNWHFVDIPKSAAGFSQDRDCFLPTNSHVGAATDHYNCVVDRITVFKQILSDTTKSPQDRQEALKFIASTSSETCTSRSMLSETKPEATASTLSRAELSDMFMAPGIVE